MSPSGKVHGPRPADSAGVAWAGRNLVAQPFAGDDGSTPPAVDAALAALAAARREGGDEAVLRAEAAVVAALAGSRLLVPIVAVLGEGEDAVATDGDKNADMALVTLTGRDGQKALPVFTSVAACAAWNASARPVPVEAERGALAAVGEGCDVVALDPSGPVSLVVRRPALWALGQGGSWTPAPFDPEVHAAVARAAAGLPDVVEACCAVGRSAETAVVIGLRPGLDRAGLDAVLRELSERLAADGVVAERVDGLELRAVVAG